MHRIIKSLNEGFRVQGHNPDVDISAIETIWHAGGLYPWASLGANGTLSVVSSSVEDDVTKVGPAGTGAYAVLVTGVKLETIGDTAGFRLVTETIALTGTVPATSTSQFAYVFKMLVTSTGSQLENVGVLTASIGGTTVDVMDAAGNISETAIFVVPHFTTEGTVIHGAFMLDAYAYLYEKANATVMGSVNVAMPGTNIFSARVLGALTLDSPFHLNGNAHFLYLPGTKIEMRAEDSSANDQAIFAGCTLQFEV